MRICYANKTHESISPTLGTTDNCSPNDVLVTDHSHCYRQAGCPSDISNVSYTLTQRLFIHSGLLLASSESEALLLPSQLGLYGNPDLQFRYLGKRLISSPELFWFVFYFVGSLPVRFL